MKRAVFLDRDGVLLDHNGSIFPGTRTQLDRLKSAGFFLAVVTNQPDVATGKIKREILDRIHVNMEKVLPVDSVTVCPHEDADKCKCRKPLPGMIVSTAKKYDLDIPRSFMVGDRWRDIGAGKAAGCPTVLIGTGYGEPMRDQPDHRAADMETAVNIILESA